MDPKSKPARIMVVDDDADTVAILCRHLEREGFIPIKAHGGAECLRLIAGAGVDLILLDLMMPEVSGFEVCKALKGDPRTAGLPIIIVTARDDMESRVEGMRLGVTEFLTKPFSRRQLISRIHAQLEMLAAGKATEAALEKLKARDD